MKPPLGAVLRSRESERDERVELFGDEPDVQYWPDEPEGIERRGLPGAAWGPSLVRHDDSVVDPGLFCESEKHAQWKALEVKIGDLQTSNAKFQKKFEEFLLLFQKSIN